MKDIIKVQIEHSPRFNPDIPWFAKLESPIFSKQKHFRSLPDALAWAIKEVVKE